MLSSMSKGILDHGKEMTTHVELKGSNTSSDPLEGKYEEHIR